MQMQRLAKLPVILKLEEANWGLVHMRTYQQDCAAAEGRDNRSSLLGPQMEEGEQQEVRNELVLKQNGILKKAKHTI